MRTNGDGFCCSCLSQQAQVCARALKHACMQPRTVYAHSFGLGFLTYVHTLVMPCTLLGTLLVCLTSSRFAAEFVRVSTERLVQAPRSTGLNTCSALSQPADLLAHKGKVYLTLQSHNARGERHPPSSLMPLLESDNLIKGLHSRTHVPPNSPSHTAMVVTRRQSRGPTEARSDDGELNHCPLCILWAVGYLAVHLTLHSLTLSSRVVKG